MRLNRFLSQCGLGSRRGCEQIISDGRVTINGKTVTELGTQVSAGDEVSVDGRPTRTESPIVIALNKPKGYICSRADERDRMTIYSLLPKQLQTLHHVGRLDKESEGLLLMTNRGDLSHHLIHPSKGAEKEYEVVVDKPVDQNIMAKLVHGMMTEEGHAKAERAWMQTDYRCHLVLKQGLKRQIRLMFYQLGFEVERLTRTRIGWLEVKGLPKGSWKQLTEAEVQRFFTEAGTTGRTKPAGEGKAARTKPAGEGKSVRSKAVRRDDDDDDELSAPARPARGGATKRPAAKGKGGFSKGRGRGKSEGTQPSSGRLVGRARYAQAAAAERAAESRPAASEGRRSRSGPPRRSSGPPDRSGPSRRPRFEDREDSFEGGHGDSPRRSGPPRRAGGFRDRDESFSEDSGPPRRPSKFGDRSGPRRPRPAGRDDSADRSGPPRRSGFGDRRPSGSRGSFGPSEDRSGPPRRGGGFRDRDESFSEDSGPPRRPSKFGDRPSGPPRRSGPPGRSGPPSRGGPKKPGGRGPRGKF